MVGITLICVGKLKEQYLRDACAEYAKRLSGICKLNICELAPCKLPDSPSTAQIQAALIQEGGRISEKIPKGSYVITLCIEGKLMSSEQLAAQIEKKAADISSTFTFIIGGSYGICDEIKSRSDLRLSMSPMTFPHQLARVMVLEQLYRVFQIQLGTKYHK